MIFQGLIDNAQSIIIGAVLLGVLAAAIKKIPAMLEEKAKTALGKLFAAGDAADDAWLIATVRWAEAKYGAGTGEQKAKAVVDKIIGLLPIKYKIFVTQKVRDRATILFQQSFDRIEKVALDAVAQNEVR